MTLFTHQLESNTRCTWQLQGCTQPQDELDWHEMGNVQDSFINMRAGYFEAYSFRPENTAIVLQWA